MPIAPAQWKIGIRRLIMPLHCTMAVRVVSAPEAIAVSATVPLLATGACPIEMRWRLPNRNEALSLINIAYYNPALSNAAGTKGWVKGNPFTGVQSAKYWSSSTNMGRAGLAWGVDFGNGNVGRHGKSSEMYLWCVRDGN